MRGVPKFAQACGFNCQLAGQKMEKHVKRFQGDTISKSQTVKNCTEQTTQFHHQVTREKKEREEDLQINKDLKESFTRNVWTLSKS